MLVYHTLAGNATVILLICFGKWVVFAFLFGQFGVRVDILDAEIACIGLTFSVGV